MSAQRRGEPNRETGRIAAYHEATKHSEERLRTSAHFLDWDNQPVPFKLYRNLPRIALPEPRFPEPEQPALDAIGADPREPGGPAALRVPDLATLARVLQLSAGITKRKRYPGGERLLRAYPNTGALYHIDLYLCTAALPDLPAGVYHFGPHDFALRRLREGDHRARLLEAGGRQRDLERAPVVLASASTYWRNAWKYRARAWRHCFWDAGTLHANLLAVAHAERLEPRVIAGFADAAVEGLLGLETGREGALTLVPLGRTSAPPPPAPPAPPLRAETEPLSPSEVDYPEIRAAQAASSLASEGEVVAWREGALAAPAPDPPRPAGRLVPLQPLAPLPDEGLASVIRRRGSTRAFDATRPVSFEALSALLERSTRGVPGDFLRPGETLIEHYLIANAVDGLEAGSYRYRRGERALEPLRAGSFRRQAGRLGLFQPLPADAAVNVYALVDLASVLARLGNRGYRAAQLEAAIAAGRMYLAAYALGFGATGLTFLDDEVAEFFAPHAAGRAVMFLIALGYPDRAALGLPSRPAPSVPGRASGGPGYLLFSESRMKA